MPSIQHPDPVERFVLSPIDMPSILLPPQNSAYSPRWFEDLGRKLDRRTHCLVPGFFNCMSQVLEGLKTETGRLIEHYPPTAKLQSSGIYAYHERRLLADDRFPQDDQVLIRSFSRGLVSRLYEAGVAKDRTVCDKINRININNAPGGEHTPRHVDNIVSGCVIVAAINGTSMATLGYTESGWRRSLTLPFNEGDLLVMKAFKCTDGYDERYDLNNPTVTNHGMENTTKIKGRNSPGRVVLAITFGDGISPPLPLDSL